MRTMAKAALVAGGYAAALAATVLVMGVYSAMTAGPDRDNYAGMFAFGDSVLALGVFCVAALPATGLWLYYLRAVPGFWVGLSRLALGTSAVSVLLVACEFARGPELAVMMAPLWFLLVGPLLACGFGAASFLAPAARERWVLRVAAVVPCLVVGVVWVRFVLLRGFFGP